MKKRSALKDLPGDIPAAQRQFVENGRAEPTPGPEAEKAVPLFLRVPASLTGRLRRTCLERELAGQAPWQLKDVAAEALATWLETHEKKPS